MRVLGYTWAGVRTSDLKTTARFFTDIMRLSVSYEGKGIVQFEMPSGQLFEVFASESRFYKLHACPVLGFQVADLKAARTELEEHGIEFVTGIDGDEKEAWTYFRGPDGYLYELWQTARPFKMVSTKD
jgi:catechol 2,3-dioxygenase-like lactoylglutathione lyase family enzyme